MAKIIKTPHLGDQIESLGDFIAAQRRSAELSLRQLAQQTGVSNPYLSQIERGLRRPSAEVLQQLSKALRVSAETLYVRAGILDPQEHPSTTVEMAVLADQAITERQKRVLIDVYASFVKENESTTGTTQQEEVAEPAAAARTAPTKKAAAKKSTAKKPAAKNASAGPASVKSSAAASKAPKKAAAKRSAASDKPTD